MKRNERRDAVVDAVKAQLKSALSALDRYSNSKYDPDAAAHIKSANDCIKRSEVILYKTGWV